MPRLGYRKTRTGCLGCRQRRVKCDESRPCSACTRHGLHCSLMDAPAAPDHADQRCVGSSPYKASRKRPRLLKPALRNGDPFPYLTNLVSSQQPQVSETWTSDLEFMHHFTAITWKSLPRGSELAEVWQLELPRLAFSFQFLTHQILSISAIHMAFLSTDSSNTYSIQASRHQDKAIQGLRGVLSVIDGSNCHAAFSSASLLAISSFAARADTRSQQARPGLEDLLQVFLLIRGMNGVLKSYEDIIKTGPVGGLLRLGTYQSDTPFLSEIEAQVITIANEDTFALEPYCRVAAGSLLEWMRQARRNSNLPELRVAMSWPTALSDGCIGRLRQRDVSALTILACYCRILEFLETDHWYLKGWGTYVLADIAKARLPT